MEASEATNDETHFRKTVFVELRQKSMAREISFASNGPSKSHETLAVELLSRVPKLIAFFCNEN